MDSLPQELIDRISSFLDPSVLSNTLTVSRKFHLSSERYSRAYSTFTIHPRDGSKQRLLKTFSVHPRRFTYLRDVIIDPELPDLRVRKKRKTNDVVVSREDVACREPQEELDAKDEYFTKQIFFLFETLKGFEDAAGRQGYGPGHITLTIMAPARHVDAELCLHRRYTSWRTHLLRPASLPALQCIRSLRVEGGDDQDPISQYEIDNVICKLDLRLLLDLVTRLPELKDVSWKGGGDQWTPSPRSAAIAHYYRNYEGPRRDARHNFAEALATTTHPKSLRNASLDFLFPLDHTEADQRGNLPDLIAPSVYGDPFSSALRTFSHQLRRLNLRVLADSTLFWPSHPAADIPSWPNLEDLYVYFHNASPTGTWYFQGPGGEGSQTSSYSVTTEMYPPLTENDDDYDWHIWTGDSGYSEDEGVNASFRIAPSERSLLPFLKAFAKGAEQMRRLRRCSLWTTLIWDPCDVEEMTDSLEIADKLYARYFDWGIAYAASGFRGFEGEPGENSTMRRIWWKTGAWRPDRELNELFQKVGAYDGSDLIEHYAHGEGRDGLVKTGVFERFEV